MWPKFLQRTPFSTNLREKKKQNERSSLFMMRKRGFETNSKNLERIWKHLAERWKTSIIHLSDIWTIQLLTNVSFFKRKKFNNWLPIKMEHFSWLTHHQRFYHANSFHSHSDRSHAVNMHIIGCQCRYISRLLQHIVRTELYNGAHHNWSLYIGWNSGLIESIMKVMWIQPV